MNCDIHVKISKHRVKPNNLMPEEKERDTEGMKEDICARRQKGPTHLLSS